MTTILIADDISQNRYMLSKLLQGHGYEVVAVSDGAAALSHAQSAPPALIISDLLMPIMDGFELCRRWRQDERLRTVPFIVYTATYTDPKDEKLALSLGADRFLIKPQTVEVLLATVREVLDEAIQGKPAPPLPPQAEQLDLLRQHNDALVRKLEKKVRQLEETLLDRERTQDELRESSSLLRIAGRMVRLGGFSADLGSGQLRLSDELAELLELPAGTTLTLEQSHALYAPECRPRLQALFERCAREGQAYDAELEVISAVGNRIWVRSVGEAVRDASDAIVKVQGALQDISERKRAEEEQRALQKQLIAAQRLESIGRLAGGVAHDFNNLLTVVLSYASFALGALRDGDPLRHDLEEIEKAGERAVVLTRQLLAFSRKQILEPELLDLNRVLSGVESMLRRLLGEDVRIEVRLGRELGTVLADPGQLEQVVMNLALNARDAMPEGGRLVLETKNFEVDARLAEQRVGLRPGAYVRLMVSDTGTGMDAATRERIFEPFFTTKDQGKGTGLGLSIVYGIVTQSGGHIEVDSEVGRGTTFTVYLPRAEGVAVGSRKKGTAAELGGRERVLIVEDEEAVSRIAERILSGAGYTVQTARNGREALALCEQVGVRVDLLLTDVVMPEMGGRELAERLRERCAALRILYMSGYTDDTITRNQLLAPGTHFIGKPFSASELRRKVREVLDAPA